MTNIKNINIFVENEYEKDKSIVDTKKVQQNTIKMFEYFLSKPTWVEKSCLNDYDCDLLYFDIVLCDNSQIQEINNEYRQKDQPTDVISFAIFADSPKEERFIFDNEINLGEIIISLDKTLEQAENNAHCQNSFENELNFLLAHGILHLLGYDHQDEETLKEMWELQEEMIAGANLNV